MIRKVLGVRELARETGEPERSRSIVRGGFAGRGGSTDRAADLPWQRVERLKRFDCPAALVRPDRLHRGLALAGGDSSHPPSSIGPRSRAAHHVSGIRRAFQADGFLSRRLVNRFRDWAPVC